MANVSRRNVVRSAGWAAPAVVAATAIPAYAASSTTPPSAIDFNGNSRVVRTPEQQFQIRSNPRLSYGVRVFNAEATDSVSAISITYWLPVPNMTFSSYPVSDVSNGDNSLWSTPTAGSYAPKEHGGYTWYPYTMTYLGSTDIQPGENFFPVYSFVSDASFNESLSGQYYDYQLDVTVNGELRSKYGNTNSQTFA